MTKTRLSIKSYDNSELKYYGLLSVTEIFDKIELFTELSKAETFKGFYEVIDELKSLMNGNEAYFMTKQCLLREFQ